MIIGVAFTDPLEFFDRSKEKRVRFNPEITNAVVAMEDLSFSVKNFSHTIFFSPVKSLERVTPIHNFDWNHDGSFQEPKWHRLHSFTRATNARYPVIIDKKVSTLDDMIAGVRKEDLLDKVNILITLLPQGRKRKRVEKVIFSHLLEKSLNRKALANDLLKIVSRNKVAVLKDEPIVEEIIKWTETETCARLIKTLNHLKNDPQWRENIFEVALDNRVRNFEVGYIMSFIEREGLK